MIVGGDETEGDHAAIAGDNIHCPANDDDADVAADQYPDSGVAVGGDGNCKAVDGADHRQSETLEANFHLNENA